MHKRNATATFSIPQIVLESLLILLAYISANLLYGLYRPSGGGWGNFWMYVIFTVVYILSMIMFRMYNVTTFYYIDRVIRFVLLSTFIASSCCCVVIFLTKDVTARRLFFLMFAVLSFGLTLFSRIARIWRKRHRRGNGYVHILFVGDDTVREQFNAFVDKTMMKVKIDSQIERDDPSLRSDKLFEALLTRLNVDEVLIVRGINDGTDIKMLLGVCEDMGITARLLLDIYDLPVSKHYVSSIGTYPLLTYHSVSMEKVQLFIKAVMDIVGSALGLIMLSPVFLITALAIRLESPGPVFFVQPRVGRNGKHFNMYKFRSMCIDAEAQKKHLLSKNKISDNRMFKIDDDPRVTKVGKFIRRTSIDELPQLINVLKRDMSLVGTRPPTVDEVELYRRDHRRRISIMPGITGMWQANGRSNIDDFEKVVELDKQYIDQWSLLLDIKLLFKTAGAVFARHGAS